MRPRTLLAVAALIAVAATAASYALGFFRSISRDAVDSADEMPVGSSEESAAPLLAAAPGLTSSAGRSAAGGTLYGVVRADGKRVAATVSAWRRHAYVNDQDVYDDAAGWIDRGRDPAEDAVVVSGSDGTFAIEGLAPGQYLLEAASGDARGYAWGSIRRAGERQGVELELRPADLSVTVLAVHADGSPWRARLAVGGETRRMVKEADESGTAVFSGLCAGAVGVVARADGLSVMTGVQLPRADPVVLTEPSGLLDVSGRVLDVTGTSGRGGLAVATAIVGASVIARGYSGSTSIIAAVVSAADGGFRMRVPPSTSELRCSADGYADGQLWLRGKSSGLVIAMRRRARLSGVVVDAGSRAPLAGVRVLVRKPAAAGAYFDRERFGQGLGFAVTDDRGQFLVDVDANGDVEVCAAGGGWCSKELMESKSATRGVLVSLAAGDIASVTLEAVRAARVVGRVVRADGSGVARASVVARGHAPPGRRQSPWGVLEASARSTTNEDGHFVLDAILPATDVEVVARIDRKESSPVVLGPLEPGAERTVELRLERARTIVVTVVREQDGKPVYGATVGLFVGGSLRQRESTDQGGVATLRDAPAGDASVQVSPPDGGLSSDFSLADDAVDAVLPPAAGGDAATPVAITVRLPSRADAADPRRWIAGRVCRPDGSAASDAVVRLVAPQDEGDEAPDSRKRRRQPPTAQTGADGSFRLAVGSDASSRLEAVAVWLGTRWTGTADAAAGATDVTITIRLQEDHREKRLVRVLDVDGDPVAAAAVEVRAGSSTSMAWVENGELLVPRMGTDSIALTIRDARGLDGAPLPVGPLTTPAAAFESLPAEVRLPREKTISGFVRASDGGPVVGAFVSASSAADGDDESDGQQGAGRRGPYLDETPAGAVRTMSDGAFLIRGLADGEHRLVVKAPRRFVAEPERALRVRAGATGVVVTLRIGVSVVVRVVNADGKPVQEVAVDAIRETARSPAALQKDRMTRADRRRIFGELAADDVTDGNGRARLVGLDPEATYTLDATPPEGLRGVEPAHVERWKAGDDTLRLPSPLSTRGIVRSPSGEPLAGVSVRTGKDYETRWQRVTGRDGAFVIERTEPGELELEASFGDAKASRATIRAMAGAQDVVLVLEPGAELRFRFEPAHPAPMAVFVAADGADPKTRRAVPFDGGAGGSWRVRGLRADGAYTVWTESDPVALATGLHPSSDVVTIRREAVRSIAVRVAADARLRDFTVTARRGPVEVNGHFDRPGPKGVLRVDGLAQGRWHVTVSASLDGAEWSGAADADADSDVSVALAPTGRATTEGVRHK